jgi:hypothetical protein
VESDLWSIPGNDQIIRHEHPNTCRLPEDQRAGLDRVRFDLLIGREDYPAAHRLAAKVGDTHKDNTGLQNDLGWQIATDKAIKPQDLALAETMAPRVDEATNSQDSAILDTLACGLFMQGQRSEGIQLAAKAVTRVESDRKQMLQKVFDSYKKSELPDVN